MTATSRKILFMLVKRIFQMAVEEGILGRNPAEGIKLRRETRAQMVLTAIEVQNSLTEAQATSHRFYPVWVMALKTGMRSGELYALTWPDIDLDAGVIHINKQWTNKDGICQPKNREWRTIPIGPNLKEFLQSYQREEPGFKATLFDARTGEEAKRTDYVLPRLDEWTNGMQAQVTREFCETIGVTQTKFHDLRATFITNLLASGVPLVKVMSIVGHRKMSTTDIYLRLAGVEVKGATDTMGYDVPKTILPARILAFSPK
jgi:integrase